MTDTSADDSGADDGVLWYHTIDLPDGATPGWFDLRPIVEQMPWPDVRGKRCLDVGTYDGFLAFELERRGASEVVATDIPDHESWDWPVRVRAQGAKRLADLAGAEKGVGFRIASERLGSAVRKEVISVYDLSPERMGQFDVVVCGSLMLHLRDPIRALEAIRSVCGERFLSAEEIHLDLALRHRRSPVASLTTNDDLCQWWVPNAMGHRCMVEKAGFDVLSQTRYSIAFGAAHPPREGGLQAARRIAKARIAGMDDGVPHSAVLARPAI